MWQAKKTIEQTQHLKKFEAFLNHLGLIGHGQKVHRSVLTRQRWPPVATRKLLTLTFHELHPQKLTWIPKMMGWKRNSLLTWQLLVSFQRFLGCIGYWLVNGMDFEIHAWLKSWSGLQLASVYTTHYCSFSTGGRGKLLGFTSVEINIR